MAMVMDITDQYFDLLSERYFNKLKYEFNENIKKSRDKSYSLIFQDQVSNFFYLFYNEDEQTKNITESFDFQYKLGYPIKIIIENLKPLFFKYRESKHAKQNQDLIFEKKYIKFLWLFNTALLKQLIVKNKNGDITSQDDFTYNFSLKNIKSLIQAKNEQERNDIFRNIIQNKSETIVNNVTINLEYFNFEHLNDEVIFKAFVKYFTMQRFIDWMKIQNSNEQIETQTKVGESSKKTKIKLGSINKTKPINKSINSNKIDWNTNISNFYRLVYALFHSKKIDNGIGEITSIVNYIAENFSIILKKSWQTSKTKAFKYKNNGFSNNEYFTKLNSTILTLLKNINFDDLNLFNDSKLSKINTKSTKFKWTGGVIEFYILVLALYHSKDINNNKTLESTILKFALIFDFNIKSEHQVELFDYLNKIKIHQMDIEIFDSLKIGLDNYIKILK
jgi:hypothetical protein